MKNTKIALVLVLFVAAATTAAHAQTQVFVPGTTNGGFGNPIDQAVPFVPAITVDGPGTITVTYVSGTVTVAPGYDVGPNGITGCGGAQSPLQEHQGITQPHCKNNGGLIGIFVPASRVSHSGFNALDGTKGLVAIGMMPGWLVFIGEGKTLDVKKAGTLFLGINDMWVSDNGGGFNVEVSFQFP